MTSTIGAIAPQLAAAVSIRVLVSLLGHTREDVQEAAVEVLRILAGDARAARVVVSAGATPFLVALLTTGTPRTQEAAAKTLAILAAGEVTCHAVVEAGAHPALLPLLERGTPEVRSAALWALRVLGCSRLAGSAAAPLPPLVQTPRPSAVFHQPIFGQ